MGYKSHIITLIAGILLGIFTNYLAMFFPLDIKGLLLGIGGIAVISWFLISRFSVPSTVVFQPLKGSTKAKSTFTFKNDFDALAKRFVFKANLAGETCDTLFKFPRAGLEKSSTPLSNYFMPLSKKKHNYELRKTIGLLDLTEAEKTELENSINKMHEPFFVQTGAPFEYKNTKNRLLTGRGIFFLSEFSEPGIGCVITASTLSSLSRYFEQYNNSLRDNLKRTLRDLRDDEKFRNIIQKVFDGREP